MAGEDHVSNAPPSATERTILGVLIAVHVVVILVLFRNLWFTLDAWDYLTRDEQLLPALVAPHQDHLTPLQSAYFYLGGRLAGIDYWPWFLIPRLIAYPFLAYAVHRVLWLFGVPVATRVSAAALVLFLNTSAWNIDAQFAGPIAMAATMLAAATITRTSQPTRRQLVTTGALLFTALVSSTVGMLGVVAVAGWTTLSRRIRRWWPVLYLPILTYAAWFIVYRGSAGVNLRIPPLDTAAGHVADLAVNTVTATAGVPNIVGVVVATLFVVLFGLTAVQRRIDLFDRVLLSTAAVYVASVIVIRFVNGFADPDHPRFAHNLLILLLPVGVKWLARLIRPQTGMILAAVLAATTVFNLLSIDDEVRAYENNAAFNRQLAETFATLIDRGEPVATQTGRLHPRLGIYFTPENVQRLLQMEWDIEQYSPALESTARGQMRLYVWPGGARSDEPLLVHGGSSPISDGCAVLVTGEELVGEVTSRTTIEIIAGRDTQLSFEWTDQYGNGTLEEPGSVFTHPWKLGSAFVTMAEVEGGATVSIVANHGSGVTICNLESAGSS